MKYVITGGAGHIAKPLAEKLLKAGHQVTVVGRNANHLNDLEEKGATTAVGSVEDAAFLAGAFSNADAAYTMVPARIDAADMKGYIRQIGNNYAEAIKASSIKYVVNLSSLGAHMAEGAGPVSGLHFVERSMNELKDVHILHLRPAYFFYNFYNLAGMIKHMNIIGSNFGGDEKLPMADPADISEIAADALLKLNFSGKSIRYIASDERSVNDIARILGNAIGKPDLKWTLFTDEQELNGLVQAGLPKEIASNYTEMGHAMNSGEMNIDYWQNRPQLSKTKLEDFAKEFAAAYH